MCFLLSFFSGLTNTKVWIPVKPSKSEQKCVVIHAFPADCQEKEFDICKMFPNFKHVIRDKTKENPTVSIKKKGNEFSLQIILKTKSCYGYGLCQGYCEVISDRPFHNSKASRSGDRRIVWNSGTSRDGFRSMEVVKGSVGFITKQILASSWHETVDLNFCITAIVAYFQFGICGIPTYLY